MSKRGESLTSAQIIMLVLAIVGFLVLLAILTQIGNDNYTTDEICRLSVLSRATAAEVKQGTQSLIPLQCTTSKICIVNSSSGECPQFVGEKAVAKIILPKIKSGEENEQALKISEQMAQSMYNCWNMMGQGKLDLFGSVTADLGFAQSNSKCVICSRVAVGNDVSDSVLNLVNVNAYMEKFTVPGTALTYTQAMTDGATSSYSSFKNDGGKEAVKLSDGLSLRAETDRETAFIFMQIKSNKITDVWKSQLTAAGVAGGTFFVASPGSLASTASMARYIFTPQGLAITAIAVGAVGGIGAYNSWQSQLNAAGYCGTFVSKSEDASQGCSLLQAFPYSVSNVKNLCSTIEGNI